jgi:methionyl-tRNA formyltransferase
VTYAKKITVEARIDWSKPANAVLRRCSLSTPGAWTMMGDSG